MLEAIEASDKRPLELSVRFCSAKPISSQTKLKFVDEQYRE